tara:strand:+ start:38 stop:583 length:546 start_codon:yes stop_codon:yes gene_type:complete
MKKKTYSNPPRKPKTFIVGGGAKGPKSSQMFGNITIPLSEEMSVMFGASQNKQKIEQNRITHHIERNIKNQYRQLGFNIKNINFNYKQKSTKGDVNVTGNRGETYFTGNFKSPMQRAVQLNINNVKLNKSGTLTGNVSLSSGTRGLNAPEMGRDPITNRELFDPRMNKYENKIYSGIKFDF